MIILATLIKKQTADGLVEMFEDIPLGKVYKVETNSRRVEKLWNVEKGVAHEKEIIDTWPFEGFIPTELLELGGAP